MPVALIFASKDSTPSVLSAEDSPRLVSAMNGLKRTPILETEADARLWLSCQPAPSGWFDSLEQAKAHVQQMSTTNDRISGPALFKARQELGLSPDQMARAIGLRRNAISNEKMILLIEQESVDPATGQTRQLTAAATLRLRALLAEQNLTAMAAQHF